MSSQKRRPVIIEVDKFSGHVQSAYFNGFQVGGTEEICKRLGLSDWKLLAFVKICAIREQFGYPIPKVTHELHFA